MQLPLFARIFFTPISGYRNSKIGKRGRHILVNPSDPSQLLILGSGYVGSAIAQCFPKSRSTNRKSFNLNVRSTWNNGSLALAPEAKVLWTFPAASSDTEETLALELFDTFFKNHQVFIYGSTSSYQVSHADEWVTEQTPLNMDQHRTRTEEKLRINGACILTLAGIFGPARDPVSWYQKGFIQAGQSYLNLIHLQDIVAITQKIFRTQETAGQRFNLSNGQPKTHLEIVETLKSQGRLPIDFSIPDIRESGSKRVSNEKIRRLLSIKNEDFIVFSELSIFQKNNADATN